MDAIEIGGVGEGGGGGGGGTKYENPFGVPGANLHAPGGREFVWMPGVSLFLYAPHPHF